MRRHVVYLMRLFAFYGGGYLCSVNARKSGVMARRIQAHYNGFPPLFSICEKKIKKKQKLV